MKESQIGVDVSSPFSNDSFPQQGKDDQIGRVLEHLFDCISVFVE
jgi:hypothetical protein